MNKKIASFIITSAFMASGCSGYMQSSSPTQMFYGLFFSTTPVLVNNVNITATDSTSITMAQPVLLSRGNPTPTVVAYIGPVVDPTPISITGSVVSGTIIEGPIDVSTGGYTFNGLSGNTLYRIIVLAQNSSGYSSASAMQSTGGIAPVMDPLAITFTDDTNITLQQPNFSTPGNPLPPTQTRTAYIGPADGPIASRISVNYLTGLVSNYDLVIGPQDVSLAGYNFSGLTPSTAYRIIVVAENSSGLSIREITQNTAYAGPVMDALSLMATTNTSITLSVPVFSTPGNPLPPVQTRLAYVGPADGGSPMTVDYLTGAVANNIGAAVDVNSVAFPYTFAGLTPSTAYKIIVVAQNSSGLSIREIAQNTAYAGPVMDALSLTATTDTSITLSVPTFSTPGNPLPPVQTRLAYIGPADGGSPITVNYLTGTVANNIGAPVDVNSVAFPYTFGGLTPNTAYKIIVVAQNSSGLSIREIAQNTAYSGPVMDPLSLTATTDTSITLSVPTFSTPGNPLPPVQTRLAYIGPADGGSPITVNYLTGTVANNIGAPVDVNSVAFPYTFGGLTPNTAYKIIVVAQNSSGLSIREIAQNTAYSGPVMDALSLTATTAISITLSVPTFSTPGNPLPPVQTRFAYIGPADGGFPISVNYLTGVVVNNIGAPVDVNAVAFPYTFAGLTPNTAYKIIVVAQNSSGMSIREIAQNTAYAGPVMDPLSLTATTDTSITLSVPTFSTPGNPLPPVQTRLAYIGPADGGSPITVNYLTGAVANNIGAAVDVNSVAFPYAFGSLTPGMAYKIIVVAQNSSGMSIREIAQNTAYAGPVMDPLSLTATTDTSITLSVPTFSTPGNPLPPVQTRLAYIGPAGGGSPITVDYLTGAVINNIGAAVDVNSVVFPYTFGSLTPGTAYKIIVVAQNSSGLAIREIAQNTAYAGPVMDPLSLTATTANSITLSVPTFSTPGNPLPPVQTRLAYIGPAGGGSPITVNYLTGAVINNIGAAVDVNSVGFPYTFPGLTPGTAYKIIVVAQNSSGLSIREIAQNTAYAGPVMDALSLTAIADTSITLSVPTFSTPGNPLPPVQTRLAYIGPADGGSPITVNYLTGAVANNIGAAVDVNSVAFPYTFGGLTQNTAYTIIVVAQNSSGLSIRQISANTGCIAPIMDNLILTPGAPTSADITLTAPTFSITGDPAPTVLGWIGDEGSISVSGTTVSGPGIIESSVDVSGGYPFNVAAPLTSGNDYRVIVISQSSCGYSVRQAVVTAP